MLPRRERLLSIWHVDSRALFGPKELLESGTFCPNDLLQSGAVCPNDLLQSGAVCLHDLLQSGAAGQIVCHRQAQCARMMSERRTLFARMICYLYSDNVSLTYLAHPHVLNKRAPIFHVISTSVARKRASIVHLGCQQSGFVCPTELLESGAACPMFSLQSGVVCPNGLLQSGALCPNDSLQSGALGPNSLLQTGAVRPNDEQKSNVVCPNYLLPQFCQGVPYLVGPPTFTQRTGAHLPCYEYQCCQGESVKFTFGMSTVGRCLPEGVPRVGRLLPE